MWSAELSVERVPGYKDEQCTEAMFAVLLIWASSCYSWLASNFGWIRLLNNQQWPPEFSAECAQIGPTKEWIAYLGVCNLYVCVGQDRHTYDLSVRTCGLTHIQYLGIGISVHSAIRGYHWIFRPVVVSYSAGLARTVHYTPYMPVYLVISLKTIPYVHRICRVGQNHIFVRIYGVHTVFLAGESPYIRSYTVCIYGSGQPYVYVEFWPTLSISECS